MNESASAAGATVAYRVLALSCVVHALVVFTVWTAMFVSNLDLMSGKIWLTLAWLWLIWPAALMFQPGRTLRRVAWPVLIAVGLLVPCAPVIFTFSVWAVRGFV